MKHKMSTWIIINFICANLLFVNASDSNAMTYHVRIDGNDTACNGSVNASNAAAPNCAFRTVQTGINRASNAGDIVIIHSGDYSNEWRNNSVKGGTDSTNGLITIQGAPGETAILGCLLVSHDYIKVANLNFSTIAGWGYEMVQIKSNHVQFTNNNMRVKTKNSSTPYGMTIYGTDNIISNNLIDGQSGSNFFIVFANQGARTLYENNIIINIQNCERVWDCGETGALSDDVIIRGNEVYGMTWTGDASGVHPDVIQGVDHSNNTAKRWIIENNYFHDLDSQIGINEIPNARTGNWVFRNNVFANITQRMMLIGQNSQVYNNTFYQVQSGDQNILDLGSGSDPSSDGSELKNNIFIGGSTSANFGMFNITGKPSQTMSNNYWGLPRASGYTARNNATIVGYGDTNFINGGDPKFVEAYDNCVTNSCDFRLQTGSPLISAGVNLSAYFSNDKAGITRSQWSIGAYEGGNISTLTSPKNLNVVP